MLSRQPKALNLKFVLPLALIYLTIYLAADAVAYKIVKIGPALDPGPPFIFPLTYAIADIIAEVYGYIIARNIIWLSLICQLIYAFAIVGIIHLPSPNFWHLETDYNIVFGDLIRFVLSGTVAVLSSSFINVYIISKWKILMRGKHFWLRSIASSAIGGFVLILVIIVFGYSGTMNFKSTVTMFISIYMLELLYACITVWPAWLVSGYLKHKEQCDVYDINVNYNPFSFK